MAERRQLIRALWRPLLVSLPTGNNAFFHDLRAPFQHSRPPHKSAPASTPPAAPPALRLHPPTSLSPPRAQGRLEAAVEAYERAAAAAPNLAVVLLNLAVALTERGTQLKNAGGQGFGPTILHFIV